MADIVNNTAKQRYELHQDDALAIAAYERHGDVVVFTHTVVPGALQGKGIASRLIKHALYNVRAQGLKIDPQCEFVAAYLDRHPEERDLLADAG
ncbi:GNAT family N-acetyltransferase [Sphingomonas sp.]|uniref:GNAT family N-acetyltransferase n=1 Tax=Sphingomonas sp. TaxID=28214 RepID=UPI003D6D2962